MQQQDKKTEALAFSGGSSKLASAPFVPHDDDSIERITTLGVKLTNPYLIPNMQKAYTNLGYSSSLASVTNLYVRFKPTISQVAALDSIMDAQGLEIFDTPVDYDVTYEGNYYQDPSIPDSLPTWQYAVVPANFIFPSGIINETLAQIHIPGDNYTAMETEGERLASIQDSLNGNTMYGNVLIGPNSAQDCPPCYVWDPISRQCVPQEGQCGTGYPPPAADASVPGGNIFVHDTNLNSDVPVRKARVVARRWFKIERVYTDNSGHYVFTKKFKNKVRINIKFKNDDAQVRNIRGFRLWQMFFAVKRTLGIFSGDKSAINFTFIQFPDYSAKGNMYWTAATVHNGVQEYRVDYAPSEGIGLPPQGLKIFISKAAWIGNGGGTPMFAKRADFNLATQYVLTRLSNVASIVNNIIAIVKGQIDMIIGYRYENGGVRDINLLLSDQLKETIYHELTHAAQYSALGNSWYTTFVNAETYEVVNTYISDIGYNPYGRGTDSYGPIIALGEGWAYHIGHYLADRRYGFNSSTSHDQGNDYTNNFPVAGLSSHLNLLENFDPNSATDHFKWIPTGLYYDMIDTRNDKTAIPSYLNIDDQVSGYTNQKFFNAFSSSITTLAGYKTNLLQQNGNSQSVQINSLFTQYGY